VNCLSLYENYDLWVIRGVWDCVFVELIQIK